MCDEQHPPSFGEQDRERLVRVETRIVKIMEALHLDPRSGVPLIRGQSRRFPGIRPRKPDVEDKQ